MEGGRAEVEQLEQAPHPALGGALRSLSYMTHCSPRVSSVTCSGWTFYRSLLMVCKRGHPKADRKVWTPHAARQGHVGGTWGFPSSSYKGVRATVSLGGALSTPSLKIGDWGAA